MREDLLNCTLVVVTDHGFAADTLGASMLDGSYGEVTLEILESGKVDGGLPKMTGLRLANTAKAQAVAAFFDIVSLIVIPFPSFSDGRGFSLALNLRRLGYRRRLRAQGHIIADQYAHARRCGFDEVAIDRTLAARQLESHWLAQVSRINQTYQRNLLQAHDVKVA